MKSDSLTNFTGIIPARYASSRFPGKPLVRLGGLTMVERVYRQASKALERVYVATDDEKIHRVVISFGGKSVMTSSEHRSGTDRCREAADLIELETGLPAGVIINIQGDEPFIMPEQIETLKICFADPDVKIATLIRECAAGEDIFNPNQVKAIIDKNNNAIYFSRSAIPYLRGVDQNLWSSSHKYYKHLGLYAYRNSTLAEITMLPHGSLENAESLEQNRWIENGYKIRCGFTSHESIGIDTPDDLTRAEAYLNKIV